MYGHAAFGDTLQDVLPLFKGDADINYASAPGLISAPSEAYFGSLNLKAMQEDQGDRILALQFNEVSNPDRSLNLDLIKDRIRAVLPEQEGRELAIHEMVSGASNVVNGMEQGTFNVLFLDIRGPSTPGFDIWHYDPFTACTMFSVLNGKCATLWRSNDLVKCWRDSVQERTTYENTKEAHMMPVGHYNVWKGIGRTNRPLSHAAPPFYISTGLRAILGLA